MEIQLEEIKKALQAIISCDSPNIKRDTATIDFVFKKARQAAELLNEIEIKSK